ncbi:Interferon stimulated exonuclease protein [Paragonimus heterotremus]|uniref:Interferon stimulated exonuclease protein n=1 Tax=Paragonimus heterotremus TaxID=100268 RepID=A0A8J4WXC3_9TREM|nr:Interferon stimulated exonuclease protein [Paragonimus heterotremus]
MGTDWATYYDTLDKWVREQYQSVSLCQQRWTAAVREQERTIRANLLATKQYETEMLRFHLRASENLRSAHRQPLDTGDDRHIPVQFHRYTIPHPWRRVAAELIDTLVILIIKLILIYFLSGDSSLVEVFKYFGLNILSSAPEYRTIRRAQMWAKSELHKNDFPMSKFERLLFIAHNELREGGMDLFDWDLLLIVDHIGRFIGALLEAFFISYSFFGQGPGGATVGKWLMNLRVVSCDEVIPLPDMVEVAPGTNLGITRALVRSMLKGTSFLTFFSFLCMLLFRYHRCTYDIIAGTLVVQPLPARHRPPDIQAERIHRAQPPDG